MNILRYLKVIALAAALATTATGAYAFHPGETHSGAVPQGPDCVACKNQGRQGIDVAIAAGGMVHCEDAEEEGEGEGALE